MAYPYLIVSTYYDPEYNTTGAMVTAYTLDAWNRALDRVLRYLADQEWLRLHPYLSSARNFGGTVLTNIGNFVNDNILLNKNNMRVNNMLRLWRDNPTYALMLTDAGNEAGLLALTPLVLPAASFSPAGLAARGGITSLATTKLWLPWLTNSEAGLTAATGAGLTAATGAYLAENGVPTFSTINTDDVYSPDNNELLSNDLTIREESNKEITTNIENNLPNIEEPEDEEPEDEEPEKPENDPNKKPKGRIRQKIDALKEKNNQLSSSNNTPLEKNWLLKLKEKPIGGYPLRHPFKTALGVVGGPYLLQKPIRRYVAPFLHDVNQLVSEDTATYKTSLFLDIFGGLPYLQPKPTVPNDSTPSNAANDTVTSQTPVSSALDIEARNYQEYLRRRNTQVNDTTIQ